MGHKGHYGEYSGNAKWSRDHAHTKVTKENYKASERDDAAHIDYLKRDVKDDQKFHVKDKDEKQTADEKHISKLAGDMKYDKEHHGSPAKMVETPLEKNGKAAAIMGHTDYGTGEMTREFGTTGGNRRSVVIESNWDTSKPATKTVHRLNKRTNEVKSRTKDISGKRARRILDRKYKRFQKNNASESYTHGNSQPEQ